MLVEAGAGVRATDDKGLTCLIRAARCGHTEMVRYLVGLPEVELNHRDTENNYTALHYASEGTDRGDKDITRILIDALLLKLEAATSRTS